MKKFSFIFVVITIIEIFLLFKVNSIFANVTHITGYFIGLSVVLTLSIFVMVKGESIKKKIRTRIIIINTLTLLLAPILFLLTLPKYTYHEAETKVKVEKNVKIINNQDESIPDRTIEAPDNSKQYVIHTEKNQEIVRYIFSPYSGSYKPITFEE
ncbi:hypothetical protein [Terrihalobacillus insolitus]|uniref:hypothetical protein n=1 Tax=Terrihalobacillus insolitus TaxID=2950438 RepID=UPI00233FFFAF|nr:hypothetical protein [Terrihalobacillus insolitus]MDC3413190.1 hypothetical protein [Terrihalobacillus insolitus]